MSFSLVRAVSFSDDSVSVEPPSLSLNVARSGASFAPLGRSPLQYDVWTLLVHFRHAQSICYHQLFCCNRQNLYEPWQARVGDLQELEERLCDLAGSVADGPRHLFLAELYYMNILLVQPLRNVPTSCPYGLSLLFECSIGYAQSVWWLQEKQAGTMARTYFELVKAMEVASVFLDVLSNPSCPAFCGPPPGPAPVSLPFSLPKLFKRPAAEALDQAAAGLAQMDRVLLDLGRKFGFPKSYSQLKTRLSSTSASLRARKDEF